MNLGELSLAARKVWAQKKWDDYVASKAYLVAELATKVYEAQDPAEDKPDDVLFIARGKWKATVDRKVNYLLGRAPTCTPEQETFDTLAKLIRDSAKQIYLRGSLIWLVQGDGESLDPKPSILSDSMIVYEDQDKDHRQAVIRKRIEVEIDKMSGAETTLTFIECYWKDAGGNVNRDTFCSACPDKDKTDNLGDSVHFIELNKTGVIPLFGYAKEYLYAYDKTLRHQNKTVEYNTKPLTEVKGYSGTSDEELSSAIEAFSIVRVDGNGGVTIHSRSMDSASIDLWQKRLLNEWMEVCAVVGKETELNYATSGKAMDRLFVDMENSAQELGHTIGQAVQEYFSILGKDVKVIWNTDKPTDDASIIQAIVNSRGILSQRTLLEQHPWVKDVDEEIERLNEEAAEGMADLLDEHTDEHEEDEQ